MDDFEAIKKKAEDNIKDKPTYTWAKKNKGWIKNVLTKTEYETLMPTNTLFVKHVSINYRVYHSNTISHWYKLIYPLDTAIYIWQYHFPPYLMF